MKHAFSSFFFCQTAFVWKPLRAFCSSLSNSISSSYQSSHLSLYALASASCFHLLYSGVLLPILRFFHPWPSFSPVHLQLCSQTPPNLLPISIQSRSQLLTNSSPTSNLAGPLKWQAVAGASPVWQRTHTRRSRLCHALCPALSACT